MQIFYKFTVAMILVSPALAQTVDTSEERIQSLSEQLLLGSDVNIAGVSLASTHSIPEFYAHREFRPAWTDDDKVDEFIGLIGKAEEEGLEPADYAYSELVSLIGEYRSDRSDAVLRADVDLLLTESLNRYGYHLYFGKVDPSTLDKNWNWGRTMSDVGPVVIVEQLIESESIRDFIEDHLKRGPPYHRMKEILAQYRALEANGGWSMIAAGVTLKPGMNDDRVPLIRRRLAITGDLSNQADNDSRSLDAALEKGIERFQERHNLDQDGTIGPKTLAAMNVTVDERIDQIRVTLERLRWVARDIEDDFVLVNIAAFKTYLIRDRKPVWIGRSQVGRDYRQTPVFKAQIKYLQFNPTWTVPPGILAKDILPRVIADPGYLASKNMDLIDRDGSIVDPANVEWSKYGNGRMPPYQFVQRPGPTNALGRVKFIFPNSHFVFLHDTPSKGLFERTERSFSSGCIRVENPFELAELMLDDANKWTPESIQNLVDSKESKTIFLREELTVMLLYSTVGLAESDSVEFYNDIYERDARVLNSLNEDFEYRLPVASGAVQD
jgi:murein L,D-transpeptidase YcbB/YkuD